SSAIGTSPGCPMTAKPTASSIRPGWWRRDELSPRGGTRRRRRAISGAGQHSRRRGRSMFDELKGKAVLVTGASTGIGAAVAKGFGRLGAHVVVHYNRSAAEAESVAGAIRAEGGKAALAQGDVSDSAAARRVVEEAAEHCGGLDILVNNAGHMVERR